MTTAAVLITVDATFALLSPISVLARIMADPTDKNRSPWTGEHTFE
ncbi:hypothetical protein GCM10017788_35800 [Amycolatopsis acidiphila]|nr:hypothetical protein GCM10017788_35800 [Amycolatopsis acidiphila]